MTKRNGLFKIREKAVVFYECFSIESNPAYVTQYNLKPLKAPFCGLHNSFLDYNYPTYVSVGEDDIVERFYFPRDFFDSETASVLFMMVALSVIFKQKEMTVIVTIARIRNVCIRNLSAYSIHH